MECTLKPGDQVVCIAQNDQSAPNPPVPDPTIGAIYTVKDVGLCEVGKGKGQDILVVLEETLQPRFPYIIGFPHYIFRPVRKTDITCFTDLLKQKELEDA